MNKVEREMLDHLRRGREEFGFVAIKAEFEAEGTRADEFLTLLEITRKAGLKVALKIGGAEAVTDLLTSKLYGTDYIIAPMVESTYALSKYVEARNKVYDEDERTDTEFLFNLETENTLKVFPEMAKAAKAGDVGVVFGRVDYTLSCGLPRGDVNVRRVTDDVLTAARLCAEHDLPLVVGGSVAKESLEALREIRAVRLDRFETRKVVFDGAAVDGDKMEAALDVAGAFELNWLINKQNYYNRIAQEDASRINMLKTRFGK